MARTFTTSAAYDVVDTRTGKVVAQFSDSVAAYDDADRRDAAFGAVRFQVRRDYEVMSASEFTAFMSRVRTEQAA